MVDTGTLIKRVERAEQGIGDDPCERCGDSIIVWPPGSVAQAEPHVTRRGVQFGVEASWQFYLEEQPGGRCPRCGSIREDVTVEFRPGSSFYR